MSLENYLCQLIVVRGIKAVQVSDTVEFCHYYLTQPILAHTYRFLHGMNTISYSLKDAPNITCDAQLIAITELRDLFKRWDGPYQVTTVSPMRPKPKLKLKDLRNRRKTHIPLTPPPPRVPKPMPATQYPRVNFTGVAAPTQRLDKSTPRVETSQPHQSDFPEPVDRRTWSHQSPPLPIPAELIA